MSTCGQLCRRLLRGGLGIGLSLLVVVPSAHAHGGMAGPDEIGPPLFTSVALAFVCYWVVILWPASKRKESDDEPSRKRILVDKRQHRGTRSNKRAVPKETSRLRKVENGRARVGSGSGRKAGDV
jgi:hypothetical protein